MVTVTELNEAAPGICADIGVEFSAEIVGAFDLPAFDLRLVQRNCEASERLGHAHMDVMSGAGHEACRINSVYPTVMIMCPCKDGRSHKEAEEITPDWAKAATDVLMHAVVETAQVIGD
jgi:N-carbamoyl-L-amino-acid hydrolase